MVIDLLVAVGKWGMKLAFEKSRVNNKNLDGCLVKLRVEIIKSKFSDLIHANGY